MQICSDRWQLKTIFWFSVFCMSMPIFLMSYLLISLTKSLWLYVLTLKYPQLDFVKTNKIRNLLDTNRNQGIIHVLLHISGQCDIEKVKKYFSNNVLERTNNGVLQYPKLKQSFIKTWGYYGWMRNESEFNINNHVILGASNHLGRSINENNIQENVSGLISKYMPLDLPQWQIILIPSSGDNAKSDSYFMLVRMHHLILAEEQDLRLSDILLIKNQSSPSIQLPNVGDSSDPFRNLLPPVKYIPELYNELGSIVCNKWNDLLNNYNRIEDNDFGVKPQGLFKLKILIFISFVTAVMDFSKIFFTIKDDTFVKFKYFLSLCRIEMKRRNLSFKRLFNAMLVSLHPRSVIESIINVIAWIVVTWCILIPLMWYRETIAIIRFLIDPQQPNVGYAVTFFKLTYNAIAELLDLLHMLVIAPRKIYEEIFEKNKNVSYALQNVSLCGRKVVSWSDKIKFNDVVKVCRKNGLTPNEVFFSASSTVLHTFLDEFSTPIPNNLDACARYIERDYLLGKTNYTDDVTGYILVNLPLEPYSARQIEKIRKNFTDVRQNQVPLFLLYVAQRRYDILTKILPQCWIQLLFNYLSKKFTISITKLADSNHADVEKMLWNDKILDVIYFTPPQSNISTSLTIQRFGEHIRLAVMTDEMIRPSHKKISQNWVHFIRKM